MHWTVKQGDILDEPADVLICSANCYLNLSGGVGGEILLRFGDAMQRELHSYLISNGIRLVPPGSVVPTRGCGTPYRAVLHAVAVDAFYGSSPELIEQAVSRSLRLAASYGAVKVALTALGTGYGRLPMTTFARAVIPLCGLTLPPVEQVVVCVRHREDAEELRIALTWKEKKGTL